LKLANSDFWVLAGILSGFGCIGIYEGNEIHPAFYLQSAILFGAAGCFGFKTFYFEKKEE
jgi:hypothetical protein